MKNIILILFPLMVIAQSQTESMAKLRNIKELLELDLITQKEFDSISNELKDIILGDSKKDNNSSTGFYINEKELVPEKFAESKTDILGIALTGGLAGGKTKSYLMGFKSKNILDVNNQVIILKIDRNNRASISNKELFSDIQSPNDFALVKLKASKKNNYRYVITGSASLASGYRFQIKKEEYINFNWNKIDDNTFEIKTNLNWGSYALLYVGTSAYSNNSIYTFNVEDPSAISF